jgi:hypothetical protein
MSNAEEAEKKTKVKKSVEDIIKGKYNLS